MTLVRCLVRGSDVVDEQDPRVDLDGHADPAVGHEHLTQTLLLTLAVVIIMINLTVPCR